MIPKNSTPIKNDVLINIFAKGLLTKNEMQIALYIIRWSWGFDWKNRRQDWTQPISISKIALDIGMKKGNCSRIINKMVKEKKLKLREKNVYQFNEHYKEWIPQCDSYQNDTSYQNDNSGYQNNNSGYQNDNKSYQNDNRNQRRANTGKGFQSLKETLKKSIKENIKENSTSGDVENSTFFNDRFVTESVDINTTPEIENILQVWNESFQNITGIHGHHQPPNILIKALKEYSSDDIISSIKNYKKILLDDNYYYKYKYKNLTHFIEKGLQNGGGFKLFLPDKDLNKFKATDRIINHIEQHFHPILTEGKYNPDHPYSKDNHRYYGYDMSEIEYSDQDIRDVLKYYVYGNKKIKDKFQIDKIEYSIVALLFRQQKSEYYREADKLFQYWQENKDKWVKILNEEI